LAYFELVKWHLSLQLGHAERWISLIYVRDLIDLILLAMESETALGQTYFGCGQPCTYGQFSAAIARALNRRTIRLSLPEAILTPMALLARVQGRVTGRPALLNEQRILDMRESYWLCSGERAHRELGFVARYDLDTAARETADWYRENGWL
jgi:nucleoside-diphosphate-sugar epimerase